jgi:hypothetical protein
MPAETSYIKFVNTGSSPSGKTKMWAVMNSSGDAWIGSVSWFSPWRKYVFVSSVLNCVFDEKCLVDIAQFVNEETTKHKDALKDAVHSD